MKRLLFLMAVLLVLTGCGTEPEATAPTTTSIPETQATETLPPETQAPTEPAGHYAPDSVTEVATGGTVLVYSMNRTGCSGVRPMGDDLLLFSGEDAATLTKLTDDELRISAEYSTGCAVSADSPAVLVSEKSVTYYDTATQELVFLNGSLEEVSRTPVPAAPALTADCKTAYYCSADSLRYIDLETGRDKLLKEMSYPVQTVTGLHCGETIVECTVTDKDGESHRLYLSALTGETLEQIDGDIQLQTRDDNYFAIRMDGTYAELIVGSGSEKEQVLDYEEHFRSAAPVPELGSAVVTHTYEKENNTRLNCYDLETGTLSATVTIPDCEAIRGIQADTAGRYIWFLRYDSRYECDVLCRWDVTANAVESTESILTQRYTADNPDTDGLQRCADTAAALSAAYGVEILIWNDVAACPPDEGSLTAEYQVPLIEQSLAQLESALSCYPEGFLKHAASATDSGTLKISLVRSLGSGEKGLQYWTDDSACIALCPDEKLEQNFHHELFFILENRVLGTCTTYDSWNSLNPKGFSYDLDYEAAEARTDTQWIEGEDRAFIDYRSMSFPREDRASIMEYAVTDGNEACFESDTMQKKLRKLCTGIRKAFGLTKSEEVFLWEQYLDEPLNK